MTPSTRLLNLLPAVLWAAASIALAQEGDQPVGEGAGNVSGGASQRDLIRARLTFSDDRQLATRSALREWVATDLRDQLGLKESDALNADGLPLPIGRYTVQRIQQTAQGLPIVYRESRLILNGDQQPLRLMGYHSSFSDIPSATPRVSVDEALVAAGADSGTEAAYSSRLLFWPVVGALRLAYELEGVFPAAQKPVAHFERVYVNAHNGNVLQRLSLTHTARDRRVFDFALACAAAGVNFPIPPNIAANILSSTLPIRTETYSIGHPDAERLFRLLGNYYDFLRLTLNIDSIDNRGKPLIGYIGVRFNSRAPGPQCVGDSNNAAWTPMDFMLLPNAMLAFPAVIAHEYTHGLINNGSNLVYEREPGALNEAVSDALGVTFTSWVNNGTPMSPSAILRMSRRAWEIRGPGGLMRDMANPRRGPPWSGGRRLPDHYDDFVFTTLDNGGVHINSSIINHAFYLLSEGGRHRRLRTGPDIEGIGALMAARIFGVAAARMMTPISDFEDARYAFAEAAEAYHGEGSKEWIAVHSAMDAVGILGHWDMPRRPKPSGTPSSPAPSPSPAPPPATAPPATPPSPAPPPASPPPAPPSPPVPPPATTPPTPALPVPVDANGQTVRPQAVVLASAAALVLLMASFVIYRFRPGLARRATVEPVPIAEPDSAREHRRSGEVDRPTPLERKPVGELLATDGTASIHLTASLLTSSEGLVIGSANRLCHVELIDRQISRRHARFRWLNGNAIVEDLNSAHGTQIDGMVLAPFEPYRLDSGQTINFAGVAYRLRSMNEDPTGHQHTEQPKPSFGSIWGHLIFADTVPVPLSRTLLASPEGLVIGRSPALCHVQLMDPAISRRHLRLRLTDGQLVAEDLNSAQGTEVDGLDLEPFEPQTLQPLSQVSIAGIAFRLSEGRS